ncbi:O-antigen polymerase [Glaesserella parasuis]|uniref:O-antigen polymerase n=2 Tax=Glaesserella parasuis TaxID=738 RepID=UPI00094FC087|nr:O-antigen polymerase [Glaesserella parasuis]
MNLEIYNLSRKIAIVLAMFLSLKLFFNGDLLRGILNIFLFLLFYSTSLLYENKYKRITVGYIFIFFVVYISYSFSSCYFTQGLIDELIINGENWPKYDHYYSLYFPTSAIFYIITIIYLKFFVKTKTYNSDVYWKVKHFNFFVGGIVVFILYFISGFQYEFVIPCFVFCLFMILYKKNTILVRWIYFCLIIVLSLICIDIFMMRYKVIGIIFPMLMIYLILTEESKKNSAFKSKLIIIFGLFSIFIYGVLSELYKLNVFYNGNYDVLSVIANPEQLLRFFQNQFERVFSIWIKLGGFIIEHIDRNEFYYGLTYIKFLSEGLGFEYVSLPIITAMYNLSTYAQPGLIAEGYANFHIVGAVLNILIVFLLMEFFIQKYYLNPSIFRLLLTTIPFTKIILDGGSINSAIFLILICIIFNILNFSMSILKYFLKDHRRLIYE